MGHWGIGLFQNDIGVEARDLYISLLKSGSSDEDAYRSVINELNDYIQDEDDSFDFWLALASIMFDYGRLTDEVRIKANSIIDGNADSERWQDDDYEKRKIVIDSLKAKMNMKMPPRKKVAVSRALKPSINPNDVYYFVMEGDTPYYVLILVDSWRIYDFRTDGLNDLHPVVYLKICRTLPADIEELNEIPFFDPKLRVWTNNLDSNDKRMLLQPSGFRKFKERLTYLGKFDFKRDSYLLDNPQDSTKKWNGNFGLWLYIESDINDILKSVPEAIESIGS